MHRKKYLWLFPILLVALVTPLTPTIDLAIENYFYKQGGDSFSSTPFYDFIFSYGPLPSLIIFFMALLLCPISFFVPILKKWRNPLLLIVLTMVIGSGLITHFLLKDHWGRPRPKQVIEFGGQQSFRPYYSPNFFNQPEPSKSFVCGHCSMGFYFFAFVFIGKKLHNKKLFYGALLTAIVWGSLLGYVRMAQGGHFFSDVLLSALVMWLTAFWINRIMEDFDERSHTSSK